MPRARRVVDRERSANVEAQIVAATLGEGCPRAPKSRSLGSGGRGGWAIASSGTMGAGALQGGSVDLLGRSCILLGHLVHHFHALFFPWENSKKETSTKFHITPWIAHPAYT